MSLSLSRVGSLTSENGAEIVTYDASRRLLYVVSGGTVLQAISIADPTAPGVAASLDIADFLPDEITVGGANSVAYSASSDLLAVALELDPVTDNGFVVVTQLSKVQEAIDEDGALTAENISDLVKVFTVGALPDMVTFTPDGSKVLVANEAEPDDGIDPDGSISIIDVSGEFDDIDTSTAVSTADFTSFNVADLRAEGVRIFPDITDNAASDLEPEAIAVSPDGTTAFATLQENNAIAIIDIDSATVTDIKPLGLKDYSVEGNGLDASDRDGDDEGGAINIDLEPVFGLYMPDSIASFEVDGEAFYIIANEGDDRGDADEDARGDAIRLKDLADVTSFGRNGLALDESFDSALLEDDELGRLTISSIDGDTDGDGDIDQIVAYGGRSFSVLDSAGNIVFDSGDQLAQIAAAFAPELFNANNGSPDDFDTRSDNKGAEPEAITTGVIDGTPYAFVGLERAGGGVLTFDLSDPTSPQFVDYVRSDEDIAPEGLAFISALDSPIDEPLLAVANEVSNTVSINQIMEPDFTLSLLHLADQEAGVPALDDAPRASAVINALKEGFEDNTLILSSGDAFIPGVFFSASEEAYGAPGRADILIQNELGVQAIAFGNHEFDRGTDVVRDLIIGETLAADLALEESQQVRDDGTTPPDTDATGSFDASLSGNRLTVTGEFSSLTSALFPVGGEDEFGNPESAAHIHIGDAGENGAIIRNLTVESEEDTGEDDSPLGTFSGEFEGTFDLTDEEVETLLDDGLYVNIHTDNYQAGELRGQIDIDTENPDSDGLDFGGTNFPYLSSNLDFSTDDNLADLVVDDDQAPQPNSIAATTVIEVDGESIGVVGATTPTITSISSPDDVTVLPEDFDGDPTDAQLDALAAEIQQDVDELLAANDDIDKVILLSHMQQIAIEQALATRLTDVDIIVAGGSNTLLSDGDDVLRAGDTSQGDYPIFTDDADGNPVAVVNTDGNYKYIGRFVADFDENGLLIEESYDPTESGAYATDDEGVARLNEAGLPAVVDQDVQDIIDAVETVIIDSESNVFGVSDVFLNGTRGSVRIEETNLGNLTADANLAAAKEADDSVVISIKNGGGIRNDIGRTVVPAGSTTGEVDRLPNEAIPEANKPEGGISQTDIANALSFNNGLTLLTLTAEELVEVIEFGIAASSDDDSNTQGRFPQVAGLQFSFDLTQEAGDRVQSLVVLDEDGNDADIVVQNGELVGDASRTFRTVTLGFLAGGGDGYPFPMGESANVVSLEQDEDAERTGDATFAPDGTEQDALAEFLDDNFATPETAFSTADTGREDDTRLQNLAFREDTVIGDGEPPVMSGFTPSEDGSTLDLTDLMGASAVRFNPNNISVDNASEIRAFSVDGDGVSTQVGTFSVLRPGQINSAFAPSFSLSANEGERLRFELVDSDGNITDGVNSINEDGNGVLTFGDSTLSLEIDDGTGAPNLVVDSEGDDGDDDAAVLDFSGRGGDSTVRFSVFREAAFDSTAGLYVVDDLTGQVTTENGTFQVGDEGYEAAALSRAIDDLSLSVSNNGSTTIEATVDDILFGTFITVEDPNFEESQTYFSFLGANDGNDHVKLLGNNAIGFEDLPGLGDADFNDLVVSFEII
ncbi:MAG: choice-of-anchor I family protein [Cyanobacteria bacterium P01_D01_bin.1]